MVTKTFVILLRSQIYSMFFFSLALYNVFLDDLAITGMNADILYFYEHNMTIDDVELHQF